MYLETPSASVTPVTTAMPKNDLDDILGLGSNEILSAHESTITVSNIYPRIHSTPYVIAIVGEAPGKDEIDQGKPFVGYSGRDLDRYLSRFGILRDACFIGNICQYRPNKNQIASFDWDGPQIQSGIRQLGLDLASLPRRPNLVLLLGGSALHAFKAPHVIPKKRKAKDGVRFVFPNSISDWRGSFFVAHESSPLPGVKCMATYHPAACLREYTYTPYLLLDISRAAIQATFPDLRLLVRELKINLTYEQLLTELHGLHQCTHPVGMDIEGYWNSIRCISFAPTPSYGFVVPFMQMDGSSCWTLDQESDLLREVSKVLGNPRITKVWQNGLYDRFSNQYRYHMVSRGRNRDIMLLHWENHCEFEKSLSVQNSFYTDEPFYKGEIDSNDLTTFLRYCCKDSATTKEIDLKVSKYLNPTSIKHYDFNETLLNALLYMEIRGIRYDLSLAQKRHKEIQTYIYERQNDLDIATNRGLPTTDKTILRAIVRDTMCYKSDTSKVKADYLDDYDINMRTLLGDADLTKSELGRLATALGKSINVKSAKQKAEFLYSPPPTGLGLPVQYDPQTGAVTTDYEALITLRRKCNHPSLPILIELTELRTRLSMLEMKVDPDLRIRTSYNEVGSDTGRITSSESPTHSGHNLQTIPDENELKPDLHPLHSGMRDLIIADSDCFLAKCDLKGADGWTIGANLASLGDDTMLSDLRFGLKPAHFPCYERRHGQGSTRGKTRQELKELFSEIKKSDWDYFASKQCTWGFFYLMGLEKAAKHVFNVSEGSVYVTESDMAQFKNTLMSRYNGQLWWKAMEQKLLKQPYPPKLLSPSGHLREFWGRKLDIIGQALAHEPQSVTTYATNLAVFNCWTDPENRVPVSSDIPVNVSCKLRVEPLHQVHDEALFQFKITDTAWAVSKIKQWFANEITIAGIKVTIPFEGAYGTNWAMDSKSKVGDIK